MRSAVRLILIYPGNSLQVTTCCLSTFMRACRYLLRGDCQNSFSSRCRTRALGEGGLERDKTAIPGVWSNVDYVFAFAPHSFDCLPIKDSGIVVRNRRGTSRVKVTLQRPDMPQMSVRWSHAMPHPCFSLIFPLSAALKLPEVAGCWLFPQWKFFFKNFVSVVSWSGATC